MLEEINHNSRRNRRRFLANTAIPIAAARVGVTGSARAQSNETTPADLRALKVQQMAPAAIRLPII
jgi:nitrous oxide reductase